MTDSVSRVSGYLKLSHSGQADNNCESFAIPRKGYKLSDMSSTEEKNLEEEIDSSNTAEDMEVEAKLMTMMLMGSRSLHENAVNRSG